MKFSVKELRAALDSAVKTSQDNHAALWQGRRDEYEQNAAKHHERYGAEWLTAIPKIRAAVKAGRPVTADILPQDEYRRSTAIFRYEQPKASAWTKSIELTRMENILNLIEGQQTEVSFTQLKELGAGVAVLRTVFDLARTQRSSTE